jgi:nitroimidazol reductase NimA-like FMN-containing flavoprotein (pyridoxamine 5'-phosphate oxidase superfamily)
MPDATVPPGPPSDRARVRRLADKARYDRATIDAILDAGLIAHLGLIAADGSPVVIPTAYARQGDRVVVHGSAASRMVRTGAGGAAMSLAVTHLDGMVVARSLFESSMAFRSVVVVGHAVPIDDPEEKLDALLHLSDRLLPGRVGEARRPTDKELAATRVFALPLDEATAKVSDHTIDDAADDLTLPIWAGFIPLELVSGSPVSAPDLAPGVPVPPSVAGWTPTRGTESHRSSEY